MASSRLNRSLLSVPLFILFICLWACDKDKGSIPEVETAFVRDVTSDKAIAGGILKDDGGSPVTAAGVCWSTSPLPAIDDHFTEDNINGGGFTSQIKELKENTKYHIRAYATNENGTAYGQEVSVITANAGDLPEIIAVGVSSVYSNSVNLEIELIRHGGKLVSEAGVFISRDIDNISGGDKFSIDIGGVGRYEVTAGGLDPETEYFFAAWAISSAGNSLSEPALFATTSGGPCDGVSPPAGYDVVEYAGRCWLDRNIGAARPAASAKDASSFGGLFQWGRERDGHENISSSLTPDLSPPGQQPGHGDYIVKYTYPFDWSSDNGWNARWVLGSGGVSAADPCPDGWRVPAIEEWQSAIDHGGWRDGADAFGSALRLPSAGKRDDKGGLYDQGSRGYYWSSSHQNIFGKALLFYEEGIFTGNYYRVGGMSVRCIRE